MLLFAHFFGRLLPKHFELTHGQTGTHTCTCNSRGKIIGRYFAYFMVEGESWAVSKDAGPKLI